MGSQVHLILEENDMRTKTKYEDPDDWVKAAKELQEAFRHAFQTPHGKSSGAESGSPVKMARYVLPHVI